MSITISGPSTQIPVEVVEVGQEITQNQLNAITAGTNPATGNPYVTASYMTSMGFATLASPTFTGTVTIPAGASISGYLTTSSASSTYQSISGMSSYLTTSAATTTFAPKASPTFTGTVTIPAGASISGFATLASPTFSGTPSLPTGTVGVTQATADSSTKLATTAFVKNQNYVTTTALLNLGYMTTASAAATFQTISGMSSYLTDAPSDGSEYVRKNAAWAVVTGGGGLADVPAATGLLYARRSDVGLGNVWEAITIPTVPPASVTNIDLTGNFNGYSMGSGYYSFKYDSSTNTLRMQDGVGSGISVSATAITFPDSTTLSTAPIADAPSDGNYYVRLNGAWHQCSIANVYDNNTMSNQNVLRV